MRVKNAAFLGSSLALSLIVSYLEGLIPLNFGIYGFRLGLANVIILLILMRFGFLPALLINAVRAVTINILFGNAMSLAFSLIAGICAVTSMYIALKIKGTSPIGVSVIGATVHNAAQTAVAAAMLTPSVISLLPILMLLGEATGIFTGIVDCIFLNRFNKLKI